MYLTWNQKATVEPKTEQISLGTQLTFVASVSILAQFYRMQRTAFLRTPPILGARAL